MPTGISPLGASLPRVSCFAAILLRLEMVLPLSDIAKRRFPQIGIKKSAPREEERTVCITLFDYTSGDMPRLMLIRLPAVLYRQHYHPIG